METPKYLKGSAFRKLLNPGRPHRDSKIPSWSLHLSILEFSVLVSNSMDSSPLSILEPLRLDEKQLHVNIFSYKYLAVFIVKH